jgi:pyochelin biosynthetic protein PchC
MQLFCFPHAGGSASYYIPVARGLPPSVEALAIQYPGRQDRRREASVKSIPELADRISEVLADAVDGPFAFFGHSMGAVLAYEVTRRLASAGRRQPSMLFLSGRRAPHHTRTSNVHLRSDSGLIADLRRLGGTDGRLFDDEELLASVLPVTRNDYRAIETWSWLPGEKLDVPITVLVGDSDPQTTVQEAADWSAQTSAAFALQVFSGGHFYLDQHANSVIDIVSQALRVLAGQTEGSAS